VNSVGMNSVLVSNVLITGWMCVERRGMPGRLAGCLVGLRGRTRAVRAGEVGQTGPVRLGHAGMEKGGGKRSG
jgi:hypothetical protein